MDSFNPANPRLLATVKNVQKEVEKDDTGTTFLLGADGLTVIRRPDVEQQYELDSNYANR